jgi:type IV pilus assembly protein PilC
MAKFYYIARDNKGQKNTGVEEGQSLDEVVSRLQVKGLLVVSIIPEAEGPAVNVQVDKSAAASKQKFKHHGISSDDLVLFCRQLATLLGAGVNILRSLRIISMQITSSKLHIVLTKLQKDMEAGLSLHEALSKHPAVFSDLWVNLVESGEASGNLAMVLSRLAGYLEKNAAFKAKVISALIYPFILMTAGFGALIFLTIKIIPTFAQLFKGFNMQMPFLTQILIDISAFIRFSLIWLIIAGAIAFYVFKQYLKTKAGRRKYEKFTFSLPIFGDFFRSLVIERFSSEMSTLVESGVPILYSLEITERSVDNLVMAEIIHNIKDEVREGKNLSHPLEKSGFFDPMVVQMISIGEEVGELPQMFKRINAFYQEYIEVFLMRFSSMFEPFILIFMGLVIGIMIIGMFLPIFQISQISG